MLAIGSLFNFCDRVSIMDILELLEGSPYNLLSFFVYFVDGRVLVLQDNIGQ
jgi:hypothetical protein